jgi:hypothetical protein
MKKNICILYAIFLLSGSIILGGPNRALIEKRQDNGEGSPLLNNSDRKDMLQDMQNMNLTDSERKAALVMDDEEFKKFVIDKIEQVLDKGERLEARFKINNVAEKLHSDLDNFRKVSDRLRKKNRFCLFRLFCC